MVEVQLGLRSAVRRSEVEACRTRAAYFGLFRLDGEGGHFAAWLPTIFSPIFSKYRKISQNFLRISEKYTGESEEIVTPGNYSLKKNFSFFFFARDLEGTKNSLKNQ